MPRSRELEEQVEVSPAPSVPLARRNAPLSASDAPAPAPSFDEAAFVVEPVAAVSGLRIATADGVEIVRGVDVAVRPGEALGIVGESGSGKTLTCRALLGILPRGTALTAGRVEVGGVDLTHASEREWRKVRGRRIGAVFQDPASYVNPALRIGDQLREVLHVTAGVPRRDTKARARELLDQLGLRRVDLVMRQRSSELSGGMLQRVLIAMALAADPDVLVADEATTALDVTVQAELLDLLRTLRDGRGLAVLFVSHDLAVVSQVCDRVQVFREGRVVEGGPVARVLRAPGHPYTRELLASHAEYGLERYLA